jgi:hypothetical protein
VKLTAAGNLSIVLLVSWDCPDGRSIWATPFCWQLLNLKQDDRGEFVVMGNHRGFYEDVSLVVDAGCTAAAGGTPNWSDCISRQITIFVLQNSFVLQQAVDPLSCDSCVFSNWRVAKWRPILQWLTLFCNDAVFRTFLFMAKKAQHQRGRHAHAGACWLVV